MIEDIRTYARLQLSVTGMTREQYIHAVRAYAVEKHGDSQDTKVFAERTARYIWASRPFAVVIDKTVERFADAMKNLAEK